MIVSIIAFPWVLFASYLHIKHIINGRDVNRLIYRGIDLTKKKDKKVTNLLKDNKKEAEI